MFVAAAAAFDLGTKIQFEGVKTQDESGMNALYTSGVFAAVGLVGFVVVVVVLGEMVITIDDDDDDDVDEHERDDSELFSAVNFFVLVFTSKT